MNFLFYQPLFPGESGVDQLVEIIKVNIIFCYVMELGYHQKKKWNLGYLFIVGFFV